jgi:flagellar biosynthesis protein FliQ
MQEGEVGLLLRDALMLTLKLGGPPLAAAMVVGLVMSLLQAVTQINEATLTFVPKVVAMGLTLVVTGGFMMAALSDFTHIVFDRMMAVGG